MTTNKFLELLVPRMDAVLDITEAMEALSDQGVGPDTQLSLDAAVGALTAAHRLLLVAQTDALEHEHTP